MNLPVGMGIKGWVQLGVSGPTPDPSRSGRGERFLEIIAPCNGAIISKPLDLSHSHREGGGGMGMGLH